jgi:hypothetical protein
MAEDIELLKLRAMAKSKAAQAADSEQANAPEPSFKSKAADVALTGLQAVGVPGGIVRSGIANAAGLSRPEDTLMNAPTTSEYMDRAGVPEGAKVSDFVGGYAEPGKGRFLRPEKGGMLDPSVRGVAGFAGDVALDPLTYLSGGLSAAAKTGKAQKLLQLLKLQEQSGALSGVGKAANVVLNPTELYAKGSAVRNYGKAFNYIDKQFPENPQTVAELMRQQGYVGTASGAAEKIADLSKKTGIDIGNILDEATKKGATVDMNTALAPALKKAAEIRSLGTTTAHSMANQIENEVKSIRDAYTKVSRGVPELAPTNVTQGENILPMSDLWGANSNYTKPDFTLAPYADVSKDASRVIETSTTSPQLLKNGAPISSEGISGKMFGANPDITLGEEVTRKRAYNPLEITPVEGQTNLPLGNSDVVQKGAVYSPVDISSKAPANKANATKAMLNDMIRFAPTTEEAISSRAKKAVSYPLSQEIQKSVGAADPELLKQLLEKNKLYQSTNREVQDVAERYGNQVAQQRGLLDLTPIDAILAGGGAMAGHTSGFAPAVAKKTLNIFNSTPGRTARGYAAQKYFDSALPKDEILRQLLLRAQPQENSQ